MKKVVSGCFGCISTPTPGILRQKMVLFILSFLLAMAATRYEPSFPPQLNRTCRRDARISALLNYSVIDKC